MKTILRPLAEIAHYHVHVYYDSSSRALALWLREQIGLRFVVQIGRLFDDPVGPHPQAQYEIGLFADEFARLIPWLMLNNQGLSVLIHPNTDQERDDHTGSVTWIGPALPLLAERTELSLRAAGQGEPRAPQINSQPSETA